MRRFNAIGVGVLAALVFAALTASGASAASLELLLEGTPVAKGDPAAAGVLVEECIQFSTGTVTANGKSKDKASFTASAFDECSGSATLTGNATSVGLSSAGAAAFKSKYTLTVPGPCIYSIGKFSVEFSVPGKVLGAGEAAAKLVKAGSSPSCVKKTTFPIFADVGTGPFESLFEDELV